MIHAPIDQIANKCSIAYFSVLVSNFYAGVIFFLCSIAQGDITYQFVNYPDQSNGSGSPISISGQITTDGQSVVTDSDISFCEFEYKDSTGQHVLLYDPSMIGNPLVVSGDNLILTGLVEMVSPFLTPYFDPYNGQYDAQESQSLTITPVSVGVANYNIQDVVSYPSSIQSYHPDLFLANYNLDVSFPFTSTDSWVLASASGYDPLTVPAGYKCLVTADCLSMSCPQTSDSMVAVPEPGTAVLVAAAAVLMVASCFTKRATTTWQRRMQPA